MRFHLICVWIFGFNNDYVYLLFKVMCSYLFRIIIVHGIHHWNYLGFNVFLKNGIHVDLSMEVFSYKAKTWLSINGLIINITIFSFNKLFLSFFCFCFYLMYFVPLCIWMVMEVSIACGYCTFRLKALHIFIYSIDCLQEDKDLFFLCKSK